MQGPVKVFGRFPDSQRKGPKLGRKPCDERMGMRLGIITNQQHLFNFMHAANHICYEVCMLQGWWSPLKYHLRRISPSPVMKLIILKLHLLTWHWWIFQVKLANFFNASAPCPLWCAYKPFISWLGNTGIWTIFCSCWLTFNKLLQQTWTLVNSPHWKYQMIIVAITHTSYIIPFLSLQRFMIELWFHWQALLEPEDHSLIPKSSKKWHNS